jgi:hypothetical protein
MAVEMAIWKMTSSGPSKVVPVQLGMEQRLEDMIVEDTTLVGLDLLVIGRQVATAWGGYIDVLGVDAHLHVLELKRDKTPRDVVAQTLDYGSWVQGLSLSDIEAIYLTHNDTEFGDAFAAKFGVAVPDVFNPAQQLSIVASRLDAGSDRIVTFLAESFNVPINAVFFRYFKDGDSEFLARTWLLAPDEADKKRPGTGSKNKLRAWNGQDYYVVMGTLDRGTERWEAGAKYGFVGAGGGKWYSTPLRNLKPGNRVFAYVGGAGYVGIGEVLSEVVPLRALVVQHQGQAVKVVDQPDLAAKLRTRALDDDEENTEYAVPVKWIDTREPSKAVAESGLFSSQVTVCKLRDERTIEVVSKAFKLDNESDE